MLRKATAMAFGSVSLKYEEKIDCASETQRSVSSINKTNKAVSVQHTEVHYLNVGKRHTRTPSPQRRLLFKIVDLIPPQLLEHVG